MSELRREHMDALAMISGRSMPVALAVPVSHESS
jgi:hypothetical protein